MRAVVGVGLGVFLAALAFVAAPIHADEIPLTLNADELFVSSDRTVVQARGAVSAEIEGLRLSADALDLQRGSDGQWQFEATGDVRLEFEEELTLTGDQLAAVLDVSEGGTFPRSLEAGNFQGESRFTNSLGEEHILYFRGESGQITFDEAGEVSLIEVHKAEVTTCDCCGLPFRSQPYTLRADRLQLYP
ncbi:MAG: hypothetical protein WBC63_06965, partial [Candidatus Bipolaricaulia bacterium]